MQISLENIPCPISEDEVRHLFDRYCPVNGVVMMCGDDPRHATAWVDVDSSRVGAYAIAHRLQGSMVRGHCLKTYVALFNSH